MYLKFKSNSEVWNIVNVPNGISYANTSTMHPEDIKTINDLFDAQKIDPINQDVFISIKDWFTELESYIIDVLFIDKSISNIDFQFANIELSTIKPEKLICVVIFDDANTIAHVFDARCTEIYLLNDDGKTIQRIE